MTRITAELDKTYDHEAIEAEGRNLWDEHHVYGFDPDGAGEVFSIDTPPPYVSAAHLHVGHAMSYSQAEFIVRYKRMRGYRVFYPMGFDDNGLPTERFVEQTHKVDKKKITRKAFRQLCIDETSKTAEIYERLWRAMGLSVDWSLRYSTIDPLSRATAQKSFLDLFRKNLIYRSDEPVIWDTHFDTALAQADLEWMERKGTLYDIAFHDPDGQPLVISTTRPELIPACVALFFNPGDERYQHLKGTQAQVPLFDHTVPILTSDAVEKDFGTGLMMVCTFGDGEDVKKWKEHKLDTRLCIDRHGRMTDLAGPYEGKPVAEARKAIVKDLKAGEFVLGEKKVDQNVAVGERSGQPIEYIMEPQWFIRMLDFRDEFLKKSDELEWFPEYMKVRLADWVNGLKYDWNISRQRFYGVPFPVWYVQETGEVVIADEDQLPIDPTEDEPPAWTREKYAGMTLVPEHDVMETWMTSSLTPMINTNWAGMPDRKGHMGLFPMSLRVQAFEIIRTWLFYTLVKGHFHFDSLPWKTVMISGWGLNEQGKKISKRDLERFTDADGFNRYEPYALLQKYGADAVRYWAAGSHLGQDLRYHEKDIRAGRRTVVKLWNVARFCLMQLGDFDPEAPRPAFADRGLEDRWFLLDLDRTILACTDAFEGYDYAIARERLERFFWKTFCDNYIEITKDKLAAPDLHGPQAVAAARATLWEGLRAVLALFAPFLPFVTEGLYQRIFKPFEHVDSLHVTRWPTPLNVADPQAEADMKLVLDLLSAVRTLRSQANVSQTRRLESVTLDTSGADDATKARLDALALSLRAALRCDALIHGAADGETPVDGVRLAIAVAPEDAEQ